MSNVVSINASSITINTARTSTNAPQSINVGTGIVTMTSLQIVDYINAERQQVEDAGGKKFVELLHRSFMTKVPTVLDPELAAKYFAGNEYTNGKGGKQTRGIYSLPKREAALMAMSYSYKIQAQVWDHMTRLEEEMTKQTGSPLFVVPTTLAEALRLAADKTEEVERALLIVHEQKTALAVCGRYRLTDEQHIVSQGYI